MTTLLCLNAKSRSGGVVDIEPFIERLHTLGPVIPLRLGEEDLEATVAALRDQLARIVVGGGDGTLNRVLPVLVEAAVPVGVLPLGTANDFARSLSLPLAPEAAIEVVRGGHTRRVGLAKANGHWFLNAAGIGLGPELTENLDHEKKRRLGVLAYLQSLIEVVGRRHQRRAILEIDGRMQRTSFLQITVANGIHYGGGLTIDPDAELNDGQLRVLLVKPQSAFDLVKKFASFRWGMTESDNKEALQLYCAETVRVSTRTPRAVTLDGELISETPLECRSIPQALEVFVPRDEASP